MEPNIKTKTAFTVVGMEYNGKNENDEIAQLWQQFVPRMKEVQHVVNPNASYGICGDAQEDGSFRYVAGYEVSSTEDIPEGMTSWIVPEQKYAVLPGTLKTIGETYKYIFETWLPQSQYEYAHGPDFEYYGEDFDPGGEEKLYIYVPIK